jgi:hypothetical protein
MVTFSLERIMHFRPQQTHCWPRAGVFEAIIHDLRTMLRLAEGRTAPPSAAIMDSCTLQSMPKCGPRAGYKAEKRKDLG